MKGNKFKSALRVNVPEVKSAKFNTMTDTNLLLLKLGLFPLPKNIEANISTDKKYLNIKLKDTIQRRHLLFQFPLEVKDVSALTSREDYHELMNRYNLYINDYVHELKKYASMERKYLTQRYPELIFSIKIRIKSFDSYFDKLIENLSIGKSPYINDIIAERIILFSYNGNEDEQLLTSMCDEIAKALYDFRIETNFRMKEDVEENGAPTEKEYVTKDYIEHPKENGYKSIHILMQHKHNKDFTYETQIRTFDMENISKTSGEIAHKKYKPRVLNDLSTNRVPIYSEISRFTDENGNPIIIDIPMENRFYHFYNSEKSDHTKKEDDHDLPITYERFRKEQYMIEKLLGKQFRQIREKLKEINFKTKDEVENEEVK